MMVPIEELRLAGLCDGAEELHLTDKGRQWLRQLEELANRRYAEDWAADLVQSINATNR